MDCFNLHIVLLAIILLFITVIICCHYAKNRSKLKTYCRANSIKIENKEFLKVCIINRLCYCFGNITKFEDFDFDNNFTDKKSYENILIYKILYRTFIEAKPLRIRFGQIDGFKRV